MGAVTDIIVSSMVIEYLSNVHNSLGFLLPMQSACDVHEAASFSDNQCG